MKHTPELSSESRDDSVTPVRQLYAWTRYWSRSHAIKILRDCDDLTQLGGVRTLRTYEAYGLARRLRDVGYQRVIVVDDDEPLLLGGYKNEPDTETIYQVLRLNPDLSRWQIRALYKQYRHNGLGPIETLT